MYSLRSHASSTSNIAEDAVAINKKRLSSSLDNHKRKILKVDENELFNPKSFQKGNRYDGIYDSSDSETEIDEYINKSSTDEEYNNRNNSETEEELDISGDDNDKPAEINPSSDGDSEPEEINLSNSEPEEINLSNTEAEEINSSNSEPEEINLSNSEPEGINLSNTETEEINSSNSETEEASDFSYDGSEIGEAIECSNNSDIELDDDGKIDESYNIEENEYFDVNAGPLVAIVTKHLKSKFPDLNDKDLKKAVERSLKKARADLVDEYCGAVPKDASWKAELNIDEIYEIESELKQLRKNIKDKIPSIPKIMKSGLSSLEKERALQLYDALNNTEPYSLDYMYLSMKISDMISSAPAMLSPELNENHLKLKAKMKIQTPTVEKILEAKLIESDKIRALQLYEMLQQTSFNTEDWFDTQRRINLILDTQLANDDEVTKMEEDEALMKKATISFHGDIKKKIFELDADNITKTRIYQMYTDMISRTTSDSRYSDLKDKIIWALKLPYRKTLLPPFDTSTSEGVRKCCTDVYNRLNAEIYGMKQAKEYIIQTVNDRIYNNNSRALLALKGKPGVGKTKLAKTIAKAVGLPFEKISLGGAIDSTIFKGSDNVWSGAAPSQLLQILSRVKYSNSIILLDEIDKLGTSAKGLEVQNALLHILDPTQNQDFQDAFLNDFSHDISKIWFIPAMNDDSKLDPALRDRLHIIELPSYSHEDMIQIIKKHTLSDSARDKGINAEDISITDEACRTLLNLLGKEVEESGMRPVEQAINDIISKINLLRTFNFGTDITIPLSFNLTDFKGFPYTITSETVKSLYVVNSKVPTYQSMFM